MPFRKLLPLAAVVFFVGSIPACAQAGLYATFSGQRFGGVTCPSFAAPCANTAGHVDPYGISIGGFYDLRDLGPARIGVDLRGDILTSNKRGDSSEGGAGTVREYNALAGLRATVGTRFSWAHPYAEIAAGISRNNASGTYTFTTNVNNAITPPTSLSSVGFNPNVYTVYPLVKGFVGLDVHLTDFLDIRAIELGYGEAFGSAPISVTTTATTGASGTVTTSTVSTTSSSSTHGMPSIGAGFVFHFSR